MLSSPAPFFSFSFPTLPPSLALPLILSSPGSIALSLLLSPSLSVSLSFSLLVLLMYAQAPIRAPFFPLVEIAAC